jgi:glycine cleavage system H lipoate-binding protein
VEPAADEFLLTQALPGFRAWTLTRDGWLRPATGGAGWEPGVNAARCGHGLGHASPAAGCMCGLYAFHTVHRQLAGEAVIGAIAAWGEMHVHRDGFRAGRARVLALAEPGRRLPVDRAALARAARRYGVPLVPRDVLAPVAALQTGSLPAALVDPGPRGLPAWLAARRGYDPFAQVWVEPGAGGVIVGTTPTLRRRLGERVRVGARVGEGLARHGSLRLEGDRATAELPLALAGTVTEVNRSPSRPAGTEPDEEGVCWLLRLAPSGWAESARGFDWGVTGRAATVGAARGTGAFADLIVPGELDHVATGSWGDVLDRLRAARRAAAGPRFADSAALYDELGIGLGRALERDGRGRAHLEGLAMRIAFETREPEARITLDLRRRPASVECGGDGGEIVARLRADDLPALLGGRLDLARETRTGRVDVVGPRGAALTSLAALVRWAAPHVAALPCATASGR